MKKVIFTGLIALGMFSFTPKEEVVIAEEAGCRCTLYSETYVYDKQGRVSTIIKTCIKTVCVGDGNGVVAPISVLTKE